MDLKLKELKSYLKNNKNRYLIFFLLFFFSTLLVVNIKTFLLIFLLFFLICFFVFNKNILESTLITFLVSLPFENTIREWAFYSPSLNNPYGYTYIFGITVKIILGILSLLLFCLPKYRYLLKIKISKHFKWLIIFFLLASTSSILFQNRFEVFAGYLRLVFSIWGYLIASIYFFRKENKKIFKSFILSLVVFLTFIGMMQFVRQRPLGKFIELTPGFSIEEGYSTTDGGKQYRVAGFISHPVYFGSFMSMLIPIFIGIIISKEKEIFKNRFLTHICLLTVVLSIVILLTALSRSTWINIFIFISLFYFYIRKSKKYFFIKKIPKNFNNVFWVIVIMIIIFPIVLVIITRIKSIPDLINNKDGSMFTRLELSKKAFELVATRPITGIGLNNFTLEAREKLSSDFVAPPHNTFIIFLVELGIPTVLFFIIFIFVSLWPKNIFKKGPFSFGLWIALITFLVSSQFHPLFNLDPTFDLFMFILGYYSKC